MTKIFKPKEKNKPRWKKRPPVKIKEDKKPEPRGKKRRIMPPDLGVRAAKAVDLPVDIVAGVAHLEFSGNREIVVEGLRAITAYDENMTVLELSKMKVRFMGRNIELRNFTDHSVIVDGFITSVEFLT